MVKNIPYIKIICCSYAEYEIICFSVAGTQKELMMISEGEWPCLAKPLVSQSVGDNYLTSLDPAVP